MKFHSMGRLLALAITMVLMPTLASAAEDEKVRDCVSDGEADDDGI